MENPIARSDGAEKSEARIGVGTHAAHNARHYAQVMSTGTTIRQNRAQRVGVAICDSRTFDGRTLADALSRDPHLLVGVVTGDPEVLLDALSREPGDAVAVVGSRVLREHTGLAARIRSAHAGTRVMVIGVDEPSLRRRVDACGLDGYVRRDGEIDDISSALRGVAA